MQELEAKYLLAAGTSPDRVLRRLQESLSWAGYRVQPKGGHTQSDVYYDTVDYQLQKSGWSYRLRTSGDKSRLAMKELNRSRSGVFDREEIEQTLWDVPEDPAQPPIGPVQERLRGLLRPSDVLHPLFEILNRRVVFQLHHPDYPRSLIEMAFDRARVKPSLKPQVDPEVESQAQPQAQPQAESQAAASVESDNLLPFTELEFELKQGPHELLANLLAITELEGSLVRARMSKYERGLIAAGCQLERRRPPSLSHIEPTTPWIDLAISHLRAQLYELKLYEPYAWESLHIEGVHQMRVATRRARTALNTFIDVLPTAEADALIEDIKWLTGALGPVRDLDVHLEHLNAYRQRLPTNTENALDRYQQYLLRSRRRAHGVLLDALASRDYSKLISDYGELLSAATEAGVSQRSLHVGDLAAQRIRKPLKKVRKRGRAIDKCSAPTALHRLRIDVKRLRYLLEYLLPAYPDLLADPAKRLRKLQDLLGDYQDTFVAHAHLREYRNQQDVSKHDRKVFKKLMRLEREKGRKKRKAFDKAWRRFEVACYGLPNALQPTAPEAEPSAT